MHYTKNRRKNKAHRRRSGKGRKAFRIIRKILGIFLRVFAAVLLIALLFAAGAVKGIIDDAPDISSVSIDPAGYATFIYDSRGTLLQKLSTYDSNRTAVSIENVPVDLKNAVVAIEDKRFYSHSGIDIPGIARAIFVGLKNRLHFTEGASTITQQLIKNNVFTSWTSEKTLVDRIKRKFQEQYLAVKLERRMSKDQILESYLNTINLAGGTYGVQAASKKYFNKDVWELTLSECTVLAGITNNPARYNPITHPDKNEVRRRKVLRNMLEQGYITGAEMEAALADDVYSRIAAASAASRSEEKVYSYFIDELTAQVVKDLMEKKGYTREQARQLLYSGGLRIYTTADSSIQAICDEEYSDPSNFPADTSFYLDWAMSVKRSDGTTENYSREMLRDYFRSADTEFTLSFDTMAEGEAAANTYKESILAGGGEVISERISFAPEPQSSLVIIEPGTGYVRAVVGGRGEKTASLTLNRATTSLRQPGSTFKTLAVYAPLFDSGVKSPGCVVEDEPTFYETGAEVHNSDNEYRGTITLREALVDSVNVAAVKLITEMGVPLAYQSVLDFGISTLDPARDMVQPLALGGISKGVSNLELTAAYAAIANGGTYTKPVFYTKILDQSGEIVIDNTPERRRVIDRGTASILTDVLEDVVTEGTGTEAALSTGMPVAGKTGTTNDYRNLWFVGYTPYYAMGVWAGYDDNRPLPDEGIFRTYHKTLWKKVMERISQSQQIKPLSTEIGAHRASVCGLTGLLASGSCPIVNEDLVTDSKGPTSYCTTCGGGWHYDEPADTAPQETYDYPDTSALFDEETAVYDQTDNWGDDWIDEWAGQTFYDDFDDYGDDFYYDDEYVYG